jgi:hypothetical protein
MQGMASAVNHTEEMRHEGTKIAKEDRKKKADRAAETFDSITVARVSNPCENRRSLERLEFGFETHASIERFKRQWSLTNGFTKGDGKPIRHENTILHFVSSIVILVSSCRILT